MILKDSFPKTCMKIASFFLAASFPGYANADASCSKFIDGEDYIFSYDGCILEMEKSDGPDFYLYNIKRKSDPRRAFLTIYLGGAPDVLNFYDDRKNIIEENMGKMKMETRERQGVDGKSYEAVIALPVNSRGGVEYFHVLSEKLTAEDLSLVKNIVFSIQAK
jgi:hypothetical protein